MNETPIRAAGRLLDALDDLIAREEAEARSGSGERVRSIQARISPVVARLVELMRRPDAAPLRERLAAAAERRRRNCLLMSAALSRIRSRLQDRQEALGRLRRLAPAYRAGLPQRRLNASV